MKSTSTAKSRRRLPGATDTVPSPVASLARLQTFVATDTARVLLHGFEAMRKVQDEAAHQVLERHAVAGRFLNKGDGQAIGPGDLLAAQAALLRFDTAAAMHYWQGLMAASLETQAELMSCGTRLVDSDVVLEELAAVKSVPRLPGLDAFFRLMPTWAEGAGTDGQSTAGSS